jgi:glycogen debranching enzyme
MPDRKRHDVSEFRPVESAHASPSDPHHVLATAGASDDRTRVLKHGDTFAVFDHFGHIRHGGLGEEGLYHHGTRHLSGLILELDGRRPFFLGSTVGDDNQQLSVWLTNPDEIRDGRVEVPLGTLHLAVSVFLWQGNCHWQLRARNHGLKPLSVALHLRFRADFADIFEVRGMKRTVRGRDLVPEVSEGRAVLGYDGLDRVRRRTLLRFTPVPRRLSADSARIDLSLSPGDQSAIELAVACWQGEQALEPLRFDDACTAASGASQQQKSRWCRIRSSDGRFDAWVRRAEADLHMLTTETSFGSYPYAGVPWFNTPFGRDGIITALECLWLRPELARGVLSYLAATQAAEVNPEQDAEPGKILHETRDGEMAALREMPFARYYGSTDATPLFVLLAGAYFERTGDRAFAEAIWPNVEAALRWVDRYGDADGDGFVEYQRSSAEGLIHQGWKDSDDAICHADGSPARAPVALCEVQAYTYAAKRAGAVVAAALGRAERAAALNVQADRLRERFETAFWCEDLGTYALALDREKQPCRVRSSNAGHCLFTGIADPARAARVATGLMNPDSFSGWGIRTVGALETRYNPMAYHNGTIWPHDNALIAHGFSRYGFQDLSVRVLSGLFEAGTSFELYRMPELFCGFARRPGEGPTAYPVACAPQAWAAGAVFLLLQACLGLGISAAEPRIWFHRPHLPDFLGQITITNITVASASVDLQLTRHGDDIGVRILRRDGTVDVLIAK